MSTRARRVLLATTILFAAFSFAYGEGWPDVSRLALTQSVAYDGSLRIDRYARQTEDRADFGGHAYSDKAPGISFLALPSFEALRAVGAVGPRERAEGVWHDRGLLWLAAGYFDPLGGLSPGPRYFVPALPFLALGLADAYGRWPRATALL